VIAGGRGNSIEEEREGKAERKVDEKREKEDKHQERRGDPSVMHEVSRNGEREQVVT